MFVDGVVDVEVDEASGTIVVTHDGSLVSAADLAEELTFVGLPAEPLGV
jgi:copper chaperone CopZ